MGSMEHSFEMCREDPFRKGVGICAFEARQIIEYRRRSFDLFPFQARCQPGSRGGVSTLPARFLQHIFGWWGSVWHTLHIALPQHESRGWASHKTPTHVVKLATGGF